MKKFNLKDLKPPLIYFPIKVGDAEIKKDNIHPYVLYYKNHFWMTTHFTNISDLSIEIAYGYGRCITTGIGLAIKESLLAIKPEVKEIICYEKNQDIIELFYIIAKHNNFDHSKIKIIHGDAEDISGLDCDCLFLDHYSFEPAVAIQQSASEISKNNNGKITWYWPAIRHYISYVDERNLPLTKQTFSDWAKPLNIKNMPCDLSDEVLDLIVQFKNEPIF